MARHAGTPLDYAKGQASAAFDMAYGVSGILPDPRFRSAVSSLRTKARSQWLLVDGDGFVHVGEAAPGQQRAQSLVSACASAVLPQREQYENRYWVTRPQTDFTVPEPQRTRLADAFAVAGNNADETTKLLKAFEKKLRKETFDRFRSTMDADGIATALAVHVTWGSMRKLDVRGYNMAMGAFAADPASARQRRARFVLEWTFFAPMLDDATGGLIAAVDAGEDGAHLLTRLFGVPERIVASANALYHTEGLRMRFDGSSASGPSVGQVLAAAALISEDWWPLDGQRWAKLQSVVQVAGHYGGDLGAIMESSASLDAAYHLVLEDREARRRPGEAVIQDDIGSVPLDQRWLPLCGDMEMHGGYRVENPVCQADLDRLDQEFDAPDMVPAIRAYGGPSVAGLQRLLAIRSPDGHLVSVAVMEIRSGHGVLGSHVGVQQAGVSPEAMDAFRRFYWRLDEEPSSNIAAISRERRMA